MADIKKDFEHYLVTKGFKHCDASSKLGIVSAYLENLDAICRDENLTWVKLERNIGRLLKIYGSGGEKQTLGRKNHKVIYHALKAFFRFAVDKTKMKDDSWDDVDPAILSIGVLDSDILESTLDAAAPESRKKIVDNLKEMGFLGE